MTKISAGSKTTQNIQTGKALTIVGDANASGMIYFVASGAQPIAAAIIASNSNFTLGPYASPCDVRIEVATGNIDYSMVSGTRPIPASQQLNLPLGIIKRTTVPKIGILADSRGWLGQQSMPVQPFLYTNTTNYGLPYHLTMMTGGRVDISQRLNFAVGGITTGGIISSTYAQIATNAALVAQPSIIAAFGNLTPLQAAMQSDADAIIYMCGTNDRTANPSMTAAQTQANDLQIILALQQAGKTVIALTDLPRGDATFTANRLASPQLDYHFDTAQYLRSLRLPGVHVVDVFAALANAGSATGDALLNTTYDGLHWNFSGQYLASQLIAAVLNALYPPINRLRCSNADAWSLSNPHGALNLNPMMLGTGAAIASGWGGFPPAGVTAAYSYITGSRGENRLQIALSGTPTASGPATFQIPITPADVMPGDVLQSFGDVQVAAGATGYTALIMEQRLYLSDNSAVFDIRSTGTSYATPAVSMPTTVPGGASGAYGGVVITEPSSPVPAGGIGSSSTLWHRVNMTVGTPVNLTFSVGPSDTRKVI